MSKLITTHIERIKDVNASGNGDIKLVPRGSGHIEVVNKNKEDDATVQINHASGNNVKIKAPSNNSNYDVTLPSVDPVLNEFLKVNALQGNVGGLGYGVPGDLDTTDASNYRTGTIPPNRLSLTGGNGAGLFLDFVVEITGNNSGSSIIVPLSQNKQYKLICQNLQFSAEDSARIQFRNNENNAQTITYSIYKGDGDAGENNNNSLFMPLDANVNSTTFIFEADISTKTGFSSFMARGYSRQPLSRFEGYAVFRGGFDHDINVFDDLYIYAASGSNLIAGTKLYLYEYREA